MSLQEVYRLAHTAECRLNISASRPDRNLRFVVGHLMHYESLRLRIVEIEHDIDRNNRAAAVQFQGTGHVGNKNPTQPSYGQHSNRSPPPDINDDAYEDDEEEDEVLAEHDDEDANDLGLTRFPSGSSRPPPLVPDDGNEELPEPTSPEEPAAATLEQALKAPSDQTLARNLDQIRRCPCHGHTNAPHIENVWTLPPSADDKPGITRAVAQVAA